MQSPEKSPFIEKQAFDDLIISISNEALRAFGFKVDLPPDHEMRHVAHGLAVKVVNEALNVSKAAYVVPSPRSDGRAKKPTFSFCKVFGYSNDIG